MNKNDCLGCYNDDYNHGLGGAKECFSFDKTKKLEKRYVVGVNQMPPFSKNNIRKVPPCFKPQRSAVIELDNITEDGFWKY